jgi:hypothetical protein
LGHGNQSILRAGYLSANLSYRVLSQVSLAQADLNSYRIAGFFRKARGIYIFEGPEAKEWIEKVHGSGYNATIERVFVIKVGIAEEEIREGPEPHEDPMQQLKDEN